MMENRFKLALKSVTILIGIFSIFGSCSQRTFDTKEELMAFVNNPKNGYVQNKSINGIDFSISYRPTDMLVAQELTENISKATIDSLRKRYGNQIYFNISFSKNNQEILNNIKSNRNDFAAMVKQLSFGMAEKIHLLNQDKDTVELLDYIYPRIYGMGGPTNIMFIYPREEVMQNDDFLQFKIQDMGVSTGEVGFKIPIKPIRNEPSLNL